MFLLKFLFSLLIMTSVNYHTNVINYKTKTGKPNYHNNYSISIPKIKLNESFIIGDKKLSKLNYIQLAPYANLPSQKNAHVILVAHSGNSKVSYFSKIDQLKNNDVIELNFRDVRYNYLVYKKVIISPANLQALYFKKNTINLVTCYKHNYRLVVYGKLKNQLNILN